MGCIKSSKDEVYNSTVSCKNVGEKDLAVKKFKLVLREIRRGSLEGHSFFATTIRHLANVEPYKGEDNSGAFVAYSLVKTGIPGRGKSIIKGTSCEIT